MSSSPGSPTPSAESVSSLSQQDSLLTPPKTYPKRSPLPPQFRSPGGSMIGSPSLRNQPHYTEASPLPLRHYLRDGFTLMRQHRDWMQVNVARPPDAHKLPPLIQPAWTPKFLSMALVNFVDPTVTSAGSLMVTAGGNKKVQVPPLKLYHQFVRLLERDYQNRLPAKVSYQNYRSGSESTIEDGLHIQPIMMNPSDGLYYIPEGSTASRIPRSVADYLQSPLFGESTTDRQGKKQQVDPAAEWHMTPYCHVYMAACESLEHYRNKVKPSIQALVSQLLESAASVSSTSSSYPSTPSSALAAAIGTAMPSPSSAAASSSTGNNTSGPNPADASGTTTPATATTSASIGFSTGASSTWTSPSYLIIFVPTSPRQTAMGPPGSLNHNNHGGAGFGSAIMAGTSAATPDDASSRITTSSRMTAAFSRIRPRKVAAAMAAVATASSTRDLHSEPAGSSSHGTGGIGVGGGISAAAASALSHQDSDVGDDQSDAGSSSITASTLASTVTAASTTPAPFTATTTTTTATLSKVEREILRRFHVDFPDAQICTLSTLMLALASAAETDRNRKHEDGSHDLEPQQLTTPQQSHPQTPTKTPLSLDDLSPEDRALQHIEWNAMLKSLGAAIAAGFQQRCRRYDETLRRMDAQRAMNMTMTQTSSPGTGSSPLFSFDLRNFFLVKESLAFSYEQMNLPGEALLQYEELKAFVPDVAAIQQHQQQASDALNEQQVLPLNLFGEEEGIASRYNSQQFTSLAERAMAGDVIGFRRSFQCMEDALTTTTPGIIAQAMEQYFFTREMSLLFKQHRPTDVVKRCLGFAQRCFVYRMNQHLSGPAASIIEIERWAFDFCWDIKCACEHYLELRTIQEQSGDESEVSQPGCETADGRFARAACDLLSFARLRLLRLGQLVLSKPIQTLDMLEDLRKPWLPWKEPADGDQAEDKNEEALLNGGTSVLTEGSADENFLSDALASSDAFQSRYLEFVDVFIACCTMCGRYRYAAKLKLETTGMLIARGQIANAARRILSIANIYGADKWSACNFLILFRLASLQRRVSIAEEYLDTLVKCFSDEISATAPSRALDALFEDIAVVVACQTVVSSRFPSAPLFKPVLGLEDFMTSGMTGNTERNLLKRVYVAGDTAIVTLALISYLPRAIEVDAVSISLVPFRTYVAAMEDSLSFKDEDYFRELSLPAPVAVEPGRNEYRIKWIPMTPGQFILSSVVIKWKNARFTYAAKDLNSPTIRIDLVPCDPDQRIDITPTFLLPGQEQPVTLSYTSGSDIIKSGTVRALAAPGLLIRLHSIDSSNKAVWSSTLETSLPPCKVGETVKIVADVKVDPSLGSFAEVMKRIQTLNVKVTTSFRRALPNEALEYAKGDNDDEGDMSALFLDATLDSSIASLGKRAVSVVGAKVVDYALGHALIQVIVECNTPVFFTLRGWSLNLPGHLSLEADLSECFVGASIKAGDRLAFGFHCRSVDSSRGVVSSTDDEVVLHVDIQDEYGSMFKESLLIDTKLPLSSNPSVSTLIVVEPMPARTSGIVGEPIDLSYRIDLSNIIRNNEGTRVVYRIDVDGTDWILAGKTEGLLNDPRSGSTITELHYIAIPARCGRLVRYPRVAIYLPTPNDSESLIPLGSDVKECLPFDSRPPEKHVSIAYPVSAPKRK